MRKQNNGAQGNACDDHNNDYNDANGESCPGETRGGERQATAPEDRKRGSGLVALADGHDIPITFNRSDLSRRRLRLGIGWTQHHRPLHGYSGGDERVGRAGGADSDSKMGRLRGKFALFGAHQDYKHIRRMVLELQGNEEAAAQLH